MSNNKYAYVYDKSERQITVGTSQIIETLYRNHTIINYCSSEEELAEEVRTYYKQEFIVTLKTRLNTFENKLFL